jgi:alpha-2-macroglobulin
MTDDAEGGSLRMISKPATRLRWWQRLALALLIAGCGTERPVDAERLAREAPARSAAGAPIDPKGPPLDLEEAETLQLTLADGRAEADAIDRPRLAAAEPLVASDVDALLARLPPLDDPHAGEVFALPPDSRPAPRTGETLTTPFPPPSEAGPPPEIAEGPLGVLRFAPEGEVPLAPHVSITFDQPMVAVTSHDAAAEHVPVRLDPEPPGRWRWVGTKTLLFELEGRLPMATTFEAEIPAGTASATGAVLDEAVRWRFQTPPPSVAAFHPLPGRVHDRQPAMVVVFDQRVDADAILPRLRVEAGGGLHPVTALTEKGLEAFPDAHAFARSAEAGRWVAFRTEAALPYDTPVSVVVPAGTPSAEGPRVSPSDQITRFRTYGPFQVRGQRCSGGCSPGAPWSIDFTNPIDLDHFDADAHVRIEPDHPTATVSVHGRMIYIQGLARANTEYRVFLSPEMRDAFGQTLVETEALTFRVGPTIPRIMHGYDPAVILDPAAPPAYPIHTQGLRQLRVTAYAVGPESWPAYLDWRSQQARRPPGRRVLRRTVDVAGTPPDEPSTTPVDLAEALEGGFGHLVLHVEAADAIPYRHGRPEVRVWVQRTRIGLLVWQAEDLDVLAMDLVEGTPREGVHLTLLDERSRPRGGDTRTGADGRATLPLDGSAATMLVARADDDVALLPAGLHYHRGYGGWVRREATDRLLFYVADDRRMYRPGERVHFKGWVRVAESGPEGDLEAAADAVTAIAWRAVDPRGSELAEGRATVDRFGGFSLAVDIPEDANLGHARLEITAEGDLEGSYRHGFQIQAFRRPEFEVSAEASAAPHRLGETATATVSAQYFTGEPLPGAEVTWTVTTRPGAYRPPGHDRFSFGRVVSPWGWRPSRAHAGGVEISRHAGTTGGDGTHTLRLDTRGGPPFPMSITAEAAVMDVNRQRWAASAPLLMHPAAVYVGLATERRFIGRGEDLPVDVVVVDIDGRGVPGTQVALEAQRVGWRWRGTQIEEKVEETRRCETRSEEVAVTCTFAALEGGRWRVSATISDGRGRRSRTEIERWVSGGPPPPRDDRVEAETLTLIPDQDDYAPGDVARVLVQMPFHPAEAVISLRREGILSTERVRIDAPDHTLEIPIEDGLTPGVHVHVAIAGTVPRQGEDGEPDPALPARPAFGSGILYLPVPPSHRKLSVETVPAERELSPGGATRIRVAVRDTDGRGLSGAQVLVVAVDEAVLALTGYRLPDPMDRFYGRRGAGVTDAATYPMVLIADLEAALGALDAPADALAGAARGFAADMDEATMPMARARRPMAPQAEPSPDMPGAAAPIALRADLRPLALFAPAVETGEGGEAEVALELPDNLTRYRIMAVATDGSRRFGSGESTVTARLPLMVRPSLPRFFNLGDSAELPFVVQNQTDAPMTVSLAVRAAGLDLVAGAGRRLTVPARDRVEVRLPATVGRVGPARVQVAAAAGTYADAAEISLPVWTPVTTEAFATYGTLDDGAVRQPVEAPPGARTDFGGLEVTTSSTELQALTDAVVYLANYPYACSEQIASRVLALAALVDVLDAFEAEGLPPPEALKAAVAGDVSVLASRQFRDGGFGLWRVPRHGDVAWPYLTVHVTLALTVAREKGFEVPPRILENATRYLLQIDRHIPQWYSASARRTIRAAALYVLHRMGRTDARGARALYAEVDLDRHNLETLGWLLPVLAADARGSARELSAIERHLSNRVTETAAGATFTTGYADGAHLLFHSSRRTDAVILEGLMAARPDSDLIVKTVRGLLAHRKRGRWSNTQENGWVLLALDRYFRQYEGVTPNFVARSWLGDRFAGEHRFEGRTTERHHVAVPMAWLAEGEGRHDLVLGKEGPGRMYYRVGLRYVPDDLVPPPADHGFTVERTYEAVDDPDDVRRDEDGTWRVRAGAEVRVRLTLVAPARRHHVALVDRLPAGFEPMNPALAVTGQVPPDTAAAERTGGRFWFWRWTWYEHQNLRDERAEAFASLLWAGVHTYSYVARATTPGRFVAPPPTAEEMYHPETFGRGPGEIVVVEDPAPGVASAP